MANRYRKLPAGSPVTAFSITAYNRMIDMLDWWQTNQAHSGGRPLRNLVDWDQTVFLTKNSSGACLPSYGVVGLDGPLYGPTDNLTEFKNVTPLEGVEPVVADHAGKWGVMLEMCGDGKIGRCCFAGVVPTRVYVNGVDDGYCDVIVGETDGDYTCYLGTGASGAQILWRENAGSGAGTVVWAIVRLGKATGPIPFMLKESLTPSGTATAYYTTAAGAIIDEALTFTVTDTVGDKRARGKDDVDSGAGDGAKGLVEVLADGTKAIIEIQQQAKRCTCLLQGALTDSDASITVDNISPTDGGQTPGASVTAYNQRNPSNTGGFEGDDNAVSKIEWDEDNDRWELYDVPCPA